MAATGATMVTAAVTVVLFALCAAIADAQFFGSNDPLVVHVKGQGTARGTEVRSYRGRRARAWRALPYAQPPVGALRFRPPALPPPAWNGTRDAAAEAPPCPQMVLLTREYAGQEDCLYLNVFAPYGVSNLPVLVWMHGGSFVEGHGGARFSGPDYLLEQSIVFVTFNYRLGPLGFFSTGDKSAQGNYGLKDAAAALRWVRANIASFGGDPSRVAIWGYSAGAALVHMLSLAPPARGLFDAVIFGSGSATHRWALYPDPLSTARRLGEMVNCSASYAVAQSMKATYNETQDLVTCLRQRSAEELVRTYYSFPALVGDMPMPWGPVIESDSDNDDKPFLPRAPADLLDAGAMHQVPVVTGMVVDEAVDAALSFYSNPQAAQVLEANFSLVLQNYAPLQNIDERVADEIRRFYFGSTPITKAPLENLTALFTDMFFTVESYGGAVAHARASGSDVYFYVFAFRGRVSELIRAGMATEPKGVMHADDLLYALGRQYPFPPEMTWPNTTETVAIQRLTRLWANVAAGGDPAPTVSNGTDTLLDSEWGPIHGEGDLFQYLEFDAKLRQVKGPPFAERLDLWKKLSMNEKVEKEAEARRNAEQMTTNQPPMADIGSSGDTAPVHGKPSAAAGEVPAPSVATSLTFTPALVTLIVTITTLGISVTSSGDLLLML